MGRKSKEYLATKNLLHNEYKLTQANVIDITKQAIYDTVKGATNRLLQAAGPTFIEDKISEILRNELNVSGYNSLRSIIVDKTSKLIAEKLQLNIKS